MGPFKNPPKRLMAAVRAGEFAPGSGGVYVSRTAVPESGQGEAVAAADAGFFENMLQVDFDGAGLDAQLSSYLFVF